MKLNLEKIELSLNDKKRKITLPQEPSELLAEFIRILAGDGYIGKYGKYFSFLEIAGDSRLDCEYLTIYVSVIIKNLFNLNPKVYFRKKQNTMYLRLMSKGLNIYLKKIGFPSGKKKNMQIPKWIKKDDQFMLSFIKGLSDTDGSLVLLNSKSKNKTYYPRIQIALSNKNIIQDVSLWLRNQGFSAPVSIDQKIVKYKGEMKIFHGARFRISGEKGLENWMKLVGFRNNRHLNRYKRYKKSGPAGI